MIEQLHTIAIYAFVFLMFVSWIASMSARYWKAKYEELQAADSSGWEEEARFWRRHFNKEAAEAVEDI